MKKIKFENQEKPTVNFEDLNDKSVVGFENQNGKKMIVRTLEGFYCITDEVVDLRLELPKPTLKEYVEVLSQWEKEEVFYQFDTVKDALKWMSE